MFDYADKAEDEFEIVHTSLDAYLAEVVSQAGRIGALVEGELREPGTLLYDQQWVIPGVLSSRVWIKQLNALCETLLCTWAEPTAAWAHLQLGKEVPHGFLDTAWRWLLKNHPHDSICGCSIDLVHEDMKFRFSQAKQIAERLTREATLGLAANVAGSVGDNELRVAVFNPLTALITQSVELDLQIPVEWPTFNEFFGFEPKPSFRIFGPDGAEIPYQRLRQTKNQTKTRVYATKFPQMYPTHDVRVSLPLNIPAAGYVTLTVRAGGEAEPTRYPATPSLATSERSMENEHIAVTIQSNGSLTLLDKHTGAVYERLLTFEDSADIGDGWYYGIAANDEVFTSTASAAAVSLVHDGPYLTAFCIRTTMKTPRRFVFDDTMRRTEEMVELEIESTISLRPGAHDLEVETTVYNIAEDHRLRVLFPSGARADTYLADTPFDVVERPIALAGDNHLAPRVGSRDQTPAKLDLRVRRRTRLGRRQHRPHGERRPRQPGAHGGTHAAAQHAAHGGHQRRAERPTPRRLYLQIPAGAARRQPGSGEDLPNGPADRCRIQHRPAAPARHEAIWRRRQTAPRRLVSASRGRRRRHERAHGGRRLRAALLQPHRPRR